MANIQFLNKAFEKIDRVDKQSLIRWVADLTKREKLLTTLLDLISEGIMVVDLKGRLLFANRSATRLFTNLYQPDMNESLEKLIDDRELKSTITKAIWENQKIFEKPLEILTPRYQKLYITIQPLSLTQPTPQTMQGTVVITREISGEDSERHEKYQMERLTSLLSLAAGIAHEIGNPLNSINVHLQLLQEDIKKLNPAQQEGFRHSLNVVIEETKRLDVIVRNFLKATRRKQLKLQLANIQEVIKGVVLLFKPEFKLNRIKVTAHFSSDLPSFFIDVERINQVLVNLVKNAIQAMPNGGSLVIETAHRKNACEINISDTGIGIDAGTLPKIFEAYYTTKEGGSGLGLVIAYQIIQEHSGQIEVVSNLKKGTTFKILLPIRREKLQLPGPDATEKTHEQFI